MSRAAVLASEQVHYMSARIDECQRRVADRKSRPTGRNIGPKLCKSRGAFHAYYVCATVPLPAGALVNGAPVPAGSKVASWPLARPLKSRRQVIKALARIRRRVPNAYVVESWRMLDPNSRANAPCSLVLPGAQEPGVRNV